MPFLFHALRARPPAIFGLSERMHRDEEAAIRYGVISTLVGCAIGAIATGSFASADTIARYECATVGLPTQEPIGDRADHNIVTVEYSCVGVDGVMKGGVFTASNTVEWDGSNGTFLIGGGVHRIAGGRAVLQMIEGAASIVVKDGKPVGTATSGKGLIKFASGPYAALAGRAIRFTTVPLNPIRFSVEFTD